MGERNWDLPESTMALVSIIGSAGRICFRDSGCRRLGLQWSAMLGVGKCPNVSHHPTIRNIISNRYLKVMWKQIFQKGTSIPTPECGWGAQLSTPVVSLEHRDVSWWICSRHQRFGLPTWWFIPLSKWVTTLVINGISGVSPLITGVITHLLSGMNHQVLYLGWLC